MMNTMRGLAQDKHLRRDNRLLVCIEDGYRYITLADTGMLINDQDIAQADIARLVWRYFDPEQAERVIANLWQQERMTIRMRIERVISAGFDQ